MVVGHGGMVVVGRARRMCAGAVLAGFSRAIRGQDGQSRGVGGLLVATHWTYATGLVWFGRFYGRVVTRQNAILAVLTGKGPRESQITTKSDLEWP